MQWYVVVLINSIIWGVVCHIVASNRGIRGMWFLWGFLFSFIPLIIILTKKTHSNQSLYEATNQTSQSPTASTIDKVTATHVTRDSRPQIGWHCPRCDKFNELIVSVCSCGYTDEKIKENALKEKQRTENNILSSGGWRCKCCDRINTQHTFICACGLKKKENDTYIKPVNDRSNKGLDTNQTENNKIDTIKKYKELLDNGAITPEEYEVKKKQLLE